MADKLTEVELPWIVWSNEHRAFWAPNRCGYTQRIEKAGRYSREEAEAICRFAAPRANSTINVGTPPEICMPAPEALSHVGQALEPFYEAARRAAIGGASRTGGAGDKSALRTARSFVKIEDFGRANAVYAALGSAS